MILCRDRNATDTLYRRHFHVYGQWKCLVFPRRRNPFSNFSDCFIEVIRMSARWFPQIMRQRCTICRYQRFMRHCRINCQNSIILLLVRNMQINCPDNSIPLQKNWFQCFPFRISGNCLRWKIPWCVSFLRDGMYLRDMKRAWIAPSDRIQSSHSHRTVGR